jgi:Rieske Fe-S protein
MDKENFNRRDFLKTSLKTIAVGTFALSAIDVKKLLAEAEADMTSTAAKVIKLSEYPALESVGGSTIIGTTFVSRTGQAKFLALSMICTHKKCDIDVTDSGFECPCHGSTFSKTGKVTNGPAKKNLKSYKTTFNADDNTLTINM